MANKKHEGPSARKGNLPSNGQTAAGVPCIEKALCKGSPYTGVPLYRTTLIQDVGALYIGVLLDRGTSIHGPSGSRIVGVSVP